MSISKELLEMANRPAELSDIQNVINSFNQEELSDVGKILAMTVSILAIIAGIKDPKGEKAAVILAALIMGGAQTLVEKYTGVSLEQAILVAVHHPVFSREEREGKEKKEETIAFKTNITWN